MRYTLPLRKLPLLVVALLLIPGLTFAQEGTIAGTVVDSTTSEPLPGVNVVVQGLNVGTATGANGQYEISDVPAGEQTLVVSYVGYTEKKVSVAVEAGATTTINIRMAPEAVGLEDVVVTALGRERSERAVATSVQEVDGAKLDRAEESNFISTLEGKVAGANIRGSNKMGGSSNIVLRGYSSISGSNQPLIVIDGVVIDNQSAVSNGGAVNTTGGYGGFDYGNAAQSINPNNIKSVSVLKGPSAAALYGSRGANGVIQITTKDGSTIEGDLGISYTTSASVSEVYNYMNYQNQYGGGSANSTFEGGVGGSTSILVLVVHVIVNLADRGARGVGNPKVAFDRRSVFRRDLNHAIRTPRAIECRGGRPFQNGHRFDVIRVDGLRSVSVVEAAVSPRRVYGPAVANGTLIVDDNSIDHDKRLVAAANRAVSAKDDVAGAAHLVRAPNVCPRHLAF
jgi:TonB-dependent SusC/RagA subfamily outer membrane receptor